MSKELILASMVSIAIHMAVSQIDRPREIPAPREDISRIPLRVTLVNSDPPSKPASIDHAPVRPLPYKEVIAAVPSRPLPTSIKKILSGRFPREVIRKDKVEKKKDQRPPQPKRVKRAIPVVYTAREVFQRPTAVEESSPPRAEIAKVKEDVEKVATPVRSRLPELFEQRKEPDETKLPSAGSIEKVQEKIEARKAPSSPIIKAKPKYKYNPRPSYPLSARRRGLEGSTLLRVEVLASGKVGRITLLHSAGHRSLDKSAIKAVKKWHFEPAMERNRPIARCFSFWGCEEAAFGRRT